MSASINSANQYTPKRYFIECCNDDFQKVASIAKKIQDLGITVEMSCHLKYAQRIEMIRAYDVVIFMTTKKFFKSEPFEMYDDYVCCQEHDKPVHCVCLENIDGISRRSMSVEAYAFWSRIRKIQGINLKASADDADKARAIVSAVENPQQREIQVSMTKYLPAFFIGAAAVLYALAVLKDNPQVQNWLNPQEPTVPLSEITSADSLSIGRHVTFGSYEQDGNTANGGEDIEWIVLDKKSDRVLLISDKLLDYVPYNDTSEEVTWSTCSLRSWMNNQFLNAAFTAQEQGQIALSNHTNTSDRSSVNGGMSTNDRVFALSEDEAKKYFSDENRAAYTTQAARGQGHASSDGADYWWLRTPGQNNEYAMDVHTGGAIITDGNSVANDSVAVRPAIWVTVG